MAPNHLHERRAFLNRRRQQRGLDVRRQIDSNRFVTHAINAEDDIAYNLWRHFQRVGDTLYRVWPGFCRTAVLSP